MAYISQYAYYENSGNNPTNANWGSYQYVSLKDIVNNFMLMYYGNHSLVNNEERFKVIFHAKRAIQELNYDAFKEIKILQLTVPDSLRFIFPSDFVNWVRISMYEDGFLYPMTENIQAIYAKAYLQDHQANILFDESGNVLEPEFSEIDIDRIKGTKKNIYLNPGSQYNGAYGWCYNGNWYFDYQMGTRYGLNTETANRNPTFNINKKAGVIVFNSDMQGKSCVLEYISDGMESGDNSLISVNKLFETYVYAYIEAEILSSKLGVQEYVVRRVMKKKRALYNNAKIRMSNLHPGRLLMNMRGMDKIIK